MENIIFVRLIKIIKNFVFFPKWLTNIDILTHLNLHVNNFTATTYPKLQLTVLLNEGFMTVAYIGFDLANLDTYIT